MEIQRESVICSRCHSCIVCDQWVPKSTWLLCMYFLSATAPQDSACLRNNAQTHAAIFHATVRNKLIYADLLGMATVLTLI